MRSVCLLSLLGLFFALPAAAAESLPFEPSEYAARRARVMDQIPDGIAIVRNSVRGPRNHDFTYLCGIEIPSAVLIIDGVRKESILLYTTSEHYLKGEGLSVDLLNHPKSGNGRRDMLSGRSVLCRSDPVGREDARHLHTLSDGDARTGDLNPKPMGRPSDATDAICQDSSTAISRGQGGGLLGDPLGTAANQDSRRDRDVASRCRDRGRGDDRGDEGGEAGAIRIRTQLALRVCMQASRLP